MRNLKITLEYDGTDFVGWQRQTEGVSVQGLLEDALARFERAPVAAHGAGRTDAGVHALGQVASVALTAAHAVDTVQRALNAALPPTVRVLEVVEEAPAFHARFSAAGKVYEYRIVNAPFVSPFVYRYAWHVPATLDVDAMREAGLALTGTHDFAAFQGTGSVVSSTTRTLHRVEWETGEGHSRPLVMRIEGDGFLRHMVRSIAGTLVEIGLGRWAPSRMREIVDSRDRGQAGPTAPASGLFLVRVRYPPGRTGGAPPSADGY
jgi:tRNA pseudouridine38-40 synthase